MSSDAIAPGWYPDPIDPSVQRYWDGEQWIGEPIPADQTPPSTPPPADPPAHPQPAYQTAQNHSAPEAPSATQPGHLGAGPAPSRYGDPRAEQTITPIFPDQLAPVSARFIARCIDLLAVLGLNIVVNGWFVYQWWQEMAPVYAEMQRWLAGQIEEMPVATDRAASLQYAIFAIGFGLWFAYEVPALASTGQTLGKRLLAIKVSGPDGKDGIGWRAAFSRWSFMAVPNLLWPCLVPLQVADALWCTWDKPLAQCLHDKWAHTIVVTSPQEKTAAGSAAPPPDGSAGT